MEDILNEILQTLDSSLKEKGEHAQFDDESYQCIKLSRDNFHPIQDTPSDKKAAFIDGGNAEILQAANFSLQLIRVYYTIYKGNKRLSSKKYEFYVLISAITRENKIEYKTDIFPISYNLGSLAFDSFDSTIREGSNRIKVSKIGEIIRKLAEIKVAEELVDELGDGGIIVRDGDLKASATYEREYLESLYKKALDHSIIITALSKTCELFTDAGNSLLAAINDLAPKTEWYYHPLASITSENRKSSIYIAKLNKNSGYAFKFEIFRDSQCNLDEVFSLLKNNSIDPVFLGYPYGLIEADRFARVSNKELDLLKMQFIAKAGKRWNKIKRYLNTANAHGTLDKIS